MLVAVLLLCAVFLLYRYRHSIKDALRAAMAKEGDMKYFTISELIYSATAKAKGIDNTPNLEQMSNLRALCINVLDKVREKYGHPITVSSGFRSPALNAAVGGVSTSQHLTGCAADLVPADSSGTVDDIFHAALQVGGYDQLIIEQNKKGSRWVHVSYRPNAKQRGQILSYNGGTYVDITNKYV